MDIKKCSFLLIFLLLCFLFLTPCLAYKYPDQECLVCHGKPETSQITKDGKVRSLFVDPEKWSQDIHHKGKILCVDCHASANPYVHFREGFIKVDCARCHPEEAEEYQKNIHLSFTLPTPGKELPLCFHCHTKHNVLPHDDLESSVNANNIGETCGSCHPEVMIKGIISGTSLGKISGHRKGDLSERFEMMICINCHYEDSAHGAKRVYKDFCSRCHNVRSKSGWIMGSIHLDSQRMSRINNLNNGLLILLFFGILILAGFKSRKGVVKVIKTWFESMKIDKEVRRNEKEDDKDNVQKTQEKETAVEAEKLESQTIEEEEKEKTAIDTDAEAKNQKNQSELEEQGSRQDENNHEKKK